MQRDLVERAMGGDREAFAQLQRRSIDRLYATARLILGDSDLAQDATQEAFIIAYDKLDTLIEPEAFPSWLRRIARRQSIAALKKGSTVELPQGMESQSAARDDLQRLETGDFPDTAPPRVLELAGGETGRRPAGHAGALPGGENARAAGGAGGQQPAQRRPQVPGAQRGEPLALLRSTYYPQ